MANVDNANGFTFIKAIGGRGELWKGTLEISNTIAKGDALIVSNTAGQVEIAVDTSPQIIGIAAEDKVTGAGATAEILYYPALPNYVFEGQCSGTFAATMINTAVDIEGATGVMEVNEDATTEDVIQIIGVDPNTEIGANSRVQFLILRSGFHPVLADKA